ncbi:hypothetical protein HYH02_015333 [Chlamydomonas schloesseri]|uniref:Uncharacterized protein n=1 Tax=Chlamydomonas schloesseri TaxID=2026947 RepID=A0A835SMH1_9CHLO|nr:hypothetical protein HYH02_015333 [Chlamydomonas schloesseri]|eukprot:KAG2423375.1 hypothetical protein HYH02_015333 [Chlamydomonas schloesseri]
MSGGRRATWCKSWVCPTGRTLLPGSSIVIDKDSEQDLRVYCEEHGWLFDDGTLDKGTLADTDEPVTKRARIGGSGGKRRGQAPVAPRSSTSGANSAISYSG